MAIKLYDDAVTEKIRKWTSSTDITIYSPNDTENLFKTIADKNNDKPIKLPIICIRRNGGYIINNANKKPSSFDGLNMRFNKDRSQWLNFIPITINYTLDVYTRYLEEADEYMRNIIFNLINYPKLTISIPYENLNFPHDSNIRIASEVMDNSDIQQRLNFGQFTRLTLNMNIDDAYLWDVRTKDNYQIDIVDIKMKNKGE